MDQDVDAAGCLAEPVAVADIADQVAEAVLVGPAVLKLGLFELVAAEQSDRPGIVVGQQPLDHGLPEGAGRAGDQDRLVPERRSGHGPVIGLVVHRRLRIATAR